MKTIILILLIQSVYDFIIWYGVYKEQSGHRLEWIFRTAKFIIDFPLTIWFIWNPLLIPFYILKWFGWCDAFYILYWKIFRREEYFTEDKKVTWLWWTPLGLIRSQIIYDSYQTDAMAEETHHLFGKWYLKKAVINRVEFYFQLLIGIVMAVFTLTII